MSDYTITATIHVTSDIDRAQLQSLVEQGVKELSGIASRYGATITESSATVEN
jgi:hypothetical protein